MAAIVPVVRRPCNACTRRPYRRVAGELYIGVLANWDLFTTASTEFEIADWPFANGHFKFEMVNNQRPICNSLRAHRGSVVNPFNLKANQ
jgi:hypothetical protein